MRTQAVQVGSRELEDLKREVQAALLRRQRNVKQSNKATFLPILTRVADDWMGQFPVSVISRPNGTPDSVVIDVPSTVYREAFRNKNGNFRNDHVNTGFAGIAHAKGPSGPSKEPFKLTIFVATIQEQGGEQVLADADFVTETFRHLSKEQTDYTTPWSVLELKGMDPKTFCPSTFGVPTSARLTGEMLKRVNVMRDRFVALPGKNAALATRSFKAALKYQVEATPSGWRIARGLYCFCRNLFIGVLLAAAKRNAKKDGEGQDLPFVDTLTSDNCEAHIWAMVNSSEGGLQGQLAKLVVKTNLLFFLDREISKVDQEINALRDGPPRANAMRKRGMKKKGKNQGEKKEYDPCNLERRKSNLQTFLAMAQSGGLADNLQEWTRVETEANKSRKELFFKGQKVGPPSYVSASKVASIPLANRDRTSVANYLTACGLPTSVMYVVRQSTVIGDLGAVQVADVSQLCQINNSAIATRCYLIRRPQMRGYVGTKNTKRCPKAPRNGQDKAGYFYQGHLMMSYVNLFAPTVARTEECMGANGVGPARFVDPGGRAFTTVTAQCLGEEKDVVQLMATEHCAGLSSHILTQCVSWEEDLANAGQSRHARYADDMANRQHNRLSSKVAEADAKAKEGDVSEASKVPAQMRRHLGVVTAGGAFAKEYTTKLEKLYEQPGVAEGENEGDAVMRDSMKEVDDEFKAAMKEPVERLRHNEAHKEQVREELKKKLWDEHLGPLWTAEIERRYQHHCGKRKEGGLEPLTRRRYLKYYVEKRLRRRAKWTQWRIRRKVKREQNRALPELVPVGTSYVFCSRLNFHDFKLPKRIMKYFGFLALCDFHDRMRMRCENVGAVLVNVNEGYTTKKCANCNLHVNVGAAKVFACPQCGFCRHRDIKVSAASRVVEWVHLTFFFPLLLLQGAFCIMCRVLFFLE